MNLEINVTSMYLIKRIAFLFDSVNCLSDSYKSISLRTS